MQIPKNTGPKGRCFLMADCAGKRSAGSAARLGAVLFIQATPTLSWRSCITLPLRGGGSMCARRPRPTESEDWKVSAWDRSDTNPSAWRALIVPDDAVDHREPSGSTWSARRKVLFPQLAVLVRTADIAAGGSRRTYHVFGLERDTARPRFGRQRVLVMFMGVDLASCLCRTARSRAGSSCRTPCRRAANAESWIQPA